MSIKTWDNYQLAFLAFCAALNVAVGAVIGIIKLPIYLDSIGTVIAAALGGWLYGSVVGVLSVLVTGVVISPTAPAYSGTAIVIAFIAWFFSRYGYLKSPIMTIVGGVVIGICAAIASAPITTYLYGGVSLAGADAATAFFSAMGNTLLESMIFGGLATDPIDQLITSLCALALIKAFPKRLFYRFPNGHIFIHEDGETGNE